MELGAQHGANDLSSVLETVHVADFVTVIGWNRKLDDAKPGEMELDNNVRVEMKII